MSDFDMILGMDFLRKNGAEIDYRRKKVWFSLENEIDCEGRTKSMMISAIKARKVLSKGYIGFLAYVVCKLELGSSNEKMPIV